MLGWLIQQSAHFPHTSSKSAASHPTASAGVDEVSACPKIRPPIREARWGLIRHDFGVTE